jgi:hypothetical protein
MSTIQPTLRKSIEPLSPRSSFSVPKSHCRYYAAFSPIAWCSFFAWMIFTTHLGHDNYLTPLMSWRGFLITTRLSYAVYLTQFPVFFFNVGLIRGTDHYDFFSSVVSVDIQHFNQ